MKEYQKILTVLERDPATKHRTVLEGRYSCREFGYLKDNLWRFTEKVDGTNIRVAFVDGRFVFGGKTDNAQIPARLVTRLNDIFCPSFRERWKEIFEEAEVCLYGEGYGAKIQKGGGNYSPTQEFVLFDVKVGEWWLERHNVRDVANKLGLRVVPIVGQGSLEDMVEMAKSGFGSCWGPFPAEGIVARPEVELVARNGSRIIAKLKRRDFPLRD